MRVADHGAGVIAGDHQEVGEADEVTREQSCLIDDVALFVHRSLRGLPRGFICLDGVGRSAKSLHPQVRIEPFQASPLMGDALLLQQGEAVILNHRSRKRTGLHGKVEGSAMVALELGDQILR